jgi:hypothetical protein
VIVDQHLAPILSNINGGHWRLLQDNAPTHVTDLIYEALNENHINWVKNLVYLGKLCKFVMSK